MRVAEPYANPRLICCAQDPRELRAKSARNRLLQAPASATGRTRLDRRPAYPNTQNPNPIPNITLHLKRVKGFAFTLRRPLPCWGKCAAPTERGGAVSTAVQARRTKHNTDHAPRTHLVLARTPLACPPTSSYFVLLCPTLSYLFPPVPCRDSAERRSSPFLMPASPPLSASYRLDPDLEDNDEPNTVYAIAKHQGQGVYVLMVSLLVGTHRIAALYHGTRVLLCRYY
eukprot:1194945-Prorocentrum_minimum.AAC.1